MRYLFLDTNILLHYQRFEDIPWKTVLGIVDDITVVICETVVAEVDKHKDGSRSRLRDRAKKMSSYISSLLLDGKRGKLPVCFCPFVKPTKDEEDRYELSVCDNRIILSALHSGFSYENIIIVSADNNLLIKAKSAGLGYYKMNDEYLLKSEPTDEEKELKATKAELAKWTNRLSNPKVVFSDSVDEVIVFPVTKPIDINVEVDRRVQEESCRYLEKRVQMQDDGFGGALNDMYRQIAALSSFPSIHSEAQIATYNAMRKEYLEAFREKTRLEVIKEIAQAAFRKIQLSIYNNGTAQTGNMFVTVNFQEGTRLYTKKDSTTTKEYPQLIPPQYDRTFASVLAMQPLTINGYIPSHSVSYMDESKPIRKLSFKYTETELIHGLIRTLESELFIDTRYEQEVEIRWSIADSAWVDHKYGMLKVIVKETVDNEER